jgi:hypothetical protein
MCLVAKDILFQLHLSVVQPLFSINAVQTEDKLVQGIKKPEAGHRGARW